MSEFLTQSELAERLVQKTGVSPEVAKRFAGVFFTIVRTGLKSSDRFSVYNFGTFKKTWIETSLGQNPFTGEKMEIPAHWRIKFIPCPAVAKRINRPFSHLKPKVIKEKKVSSDGLLAHADRLSQEKTDDEDVLTEQNNAVQENEYAADEEFYKPVSNSVPADSDDEPDDIGYDDDDEEEEEKKPWKLIALVSCGILLLILLLSLLIKSCSPKKNKTRYDVAETEKAPVDTVSEEKTAEPVRDDSVDEEQAAEQFETYTVPAGMSYHQIAEERLGDRHLWPLLYAANKNVSVDPDFVPVSADLKIPAAPSGKGAEKQIASAVLEAYNAYLLMAEKEPDSPKNEERKNRAVRVIVSGELLCPGFIDSYQSRILPDYAQTARNIAAHQYVAQD